MSNRFAADVKFVGLSEDGEYLFVTTPEGAEYRLRITPMVRAAVRLDRPAMEHHKADADGTLPPREIQARIRAGMTATEISEKAGVPLEQIQRYERPVLAERSFVAERAKATPIQQDADSPNLGEIVTDRLAARGVNILDLTWDAYKSDGHGWIVAVTFTQDLEARTARWTFRQSTHTLSAIDAESRALSETQIVDQPIPTRHLSAVRDAVFDFEAIPSHSPASAIHETEDLVDKLNQIRGTRSLLDDSSRPSQVAVAPVPNNIVQLSPQSAISQTDGLPTSAPTPASTRTSDGGPQLAPPSTKQAPRQATPPTDVRSPHESQDVLFDDPSGARVADTRPPHTGLVPVITGQLPQASQGADSPAATTHPGPHFEPPVIQASESSALARLRGRGHRPSATQPRSARNSDKVPTSGTAQQSSTENLSTANELTGKKAKGKTRSPMPTWDEIMFGAKPE